MALTPSESHHNTKMAASRFRFTTSAGMQYQVFLRTRTFYPTGVFVTELERRRNGIADFSSTFRRYAFSVEIDQSDLDRLSNKRAHAFYGMLRRKVRLLS